jgi:hypothetical protein
MVSVLVRASDVGKRDSLGLERAATKVWLCNVIAIEKNVTSSQLQRDLQTDI